MTLFKSQSHLAKRKCSTNSGNWFPLVNFSCLQQLPFLARFPVGTIPAFTMSKIFNTEIAPGRLIDFGVVYIT